MKSFLIKQSVLLCLFMILTLTLSACSSIDSDKETITVFNWGDYIAEDTLKAFTEKTGIKVQYETFDSNEAMYTKLKSGAVDYDVIIPSDYMIEKLIQEDMLLPLNFDQLPNYQNIDETFKYLAYDPENTYSVPYMWGTLGILYNTNMVSEPITSWSALWNPAYADQIIMKESVRDSFVPAFKLLGYSINTTSKDEWSHALEKLIDQKSLVQGYAGDEVRDKMIGEEAALALMYSGEALLTMEENEHLTYVVPVEGSNLWFDAMCIPNTTKHQAAAEAFINFMCDIQIGYNNADYIGYSTPMSASKAMLSEEIQKDPAAYPSEEILRLCEVYIDLGKEIGNFANEKWNELKAY